MIDLKEIEKERRKYKNRIIISIVIGIFIVVVGSVYAFQTGGPIAVILLLLLSPLIFGIFVIIYVLIYLYYSSKWNKLFKSKVLGGLIKEYFPNFIYEPFKYHSRDEFIASMLFNDYPKPDVYRGSNYIEGSYEGIDFNLSWLDARYRVTYRDNEGKTKTYYHIILNGLLIKTKSFKEIDGYVLLYPPGKGNRITIDNPEFDKYFSVHASSDFNAYYILDHAFMERLMKLKNSLNKSIRLSFQGKTLYIAIENMGFLNTPSLCRSVEKVDLDSYVKEIKDVLEFLAGLKPRYLKT